MNENELFNSWIKASCEKVLNKVNVIDDGRVKKLRPEYTKHISKYGHGWMSIDTHKTSLAVIETVKPKVILELGSWYGLSTRYLSNSNPKKDCIIYSIDRHENNATYERIKDTITPEDNLFAGHLRYETFCSNLSANSEKDEDIVSRYYFDKPDMNDKKELVVMKMDIYEGIEIFYKSGIVPDVIFVDFEKKKFKIIQILQKLRFYFPKATIIGDDYVFQSVKDGVKKVNIKFTYTFLNESYFIAPNKDLYYKIVSTLKTNNKKFELDEKQKFVLKELEEKMITKPFVKLPNQASFAINNFIIDNIDLSIKIIQMLYENKEKNFWDWPYPIHNPASHTIFDYFFMARVFFQ